MRSNSLAFVFLVISVVGCFSQSLKTPPGSLKLGADFTTLALKSVRIIGGYDGSPTHKTAGSVGGARKVLDSVDAVSDIARTKAEMAALLVVRHFMAGKVANNDGRAELVERSWLAWKRAHPNSEAEDEERAEESEKANVYRRAVVLEMNEKEEACRSQLDAMLRGGTYKRIAGCDEVEVSIQKDLQFR